MPAWASAALPRQHRASHWHRPTVPPSAGLPPVTVSWWLPLYHVGDIVKLSLLICLIDICESVSIAKSLAQVISLPTSPLPQRATCYRATCCSAAAPASHLALCTPHCPCCIGDWGSFIPCPQLGSCPCVSPAEKPLQAGRHAGAPRPGHRQHRGRLLLRVSMPRSLCTCTSLPLLPDPARPPPCQPPCLPACFPPPSA